MKAFVKLTFLVACGTLLLSSCYSPKLMVDDDVYILKNNKLPVGESLNDETSYSSYRNKKENRSVSSTFYDDEFFIRDRFHRDNLMFGMGWGNPYYNNWMYGNRPYYYYSYPFYSSMSGSINPIYLYDPFGSMIGFYPTAYDYWYFGGNYSPWIYGNNYGYGNAWNNYGYGNNLGYNYNNPGNTYIHYNHHSGPRGTTAGFGNPSNRLQGNMVKTMTQPGKEINALSNRTPVQRKVDNTSVIGDNPKPKDLKPARNNTVDSRTNPGLKPTSDRGIRTPSPTIENGARGTRPTHAPTRSNEIRNNNGGGRIDTPNRPSNGGSPSNGGGRSGGSPSNTGGRRL